MFGLGALTSLTGGGGIGGDTSAAHSGYVTTGNISFGNTGASSWMMPAAILAAAVVLVLVLKK